MVICKAPIISIYTPKDLQGSMWKPIISYYVLCYLKYQVQDPKFACVFLNIHLFQSFSIFIYFPEVHQLWRMTQGCLTKLSNYCLCRSVFKCSTSPQKKHFSNTYKKSRVEARAPNVRDITGSQMMLCFKYSRASQISITTWAFMQKFEACC